MERETNDTVHIVSSDQSSDSDGPGKPGSWGRSMAKACGLLGPGRVLGSDLSRECGTSLRI